MNFPQVLGFPWLAEHEYTICLFSFIVNLFHLAVLTRKYMRTSSIYILLIGVCLSELYSNLIPLKLKLEQVVTSWMSCPLPASVTRIYFDRITLSTRDNCARLATWLIVTLAIIRVLVLRNLTDNRFQMLSAPGFGWLLSFFLFIVSFVMSLMHYFKDQIAEVGRWMPPSGCESVTLSDSFTQYSLTTSDLYTFGRGIFAKLFFLSDGFFTHIVPCAILPILIVFLTVEVQKSKKLRTGSVKNTHQLRNEQTTKLVSLLCMLAFLIQTGYSTIFVGKLILGKEAELVKNAEVAMKWVFSFNASIRCVLCALFSCRYRNTIRRMFGFRDRMSVSHKSSFALTQQGSISRKGKSVSSVAPPSSPKTEFS